MPTSEFSELLNRLESSGIASRSELRGCTDAEILAVETRYHVMLPQTYRTYLSLMGHQSGRLLTHDHYAASYNDVLTLTDSYGEHLRLDDDEPFIELPHDAIIILGRLGEYFQVIRCSSPDDSPVWCFNVGDATLTDAFPSVLDWLKSHATESERAIRAGYYKMFPHGTTP